MCRRLLNFGGTGAAVVASAVAVAATVATADPAMEFALEAGAATSPVTAAAAEDAAAATTEDGSAMRVASVSGTDGAAARWDQLLLHEENRDVAYSAYSPNFMANG